MGIAVILHWSGNGDKKKVCTCSVQMYFFKNTFHPHLVESTDVESTDMGLYLPSSLLCSWVQAELCILLTWYTCLH
jgi:hypothetical protein